VKAYEPFFDSSPMFDDETDLVYWGVTPISRYDPLSRLIRIDNPDGSYRTLDFDPWQVITSDENDTVLSSAWYAARSVGQLGPDQADAAAKAAVDSATPTVTNLDTLGRVFQTVADNGAAGSYPTTLTLDIEGQVLAVTDALGREILTQDYNLLGAGIHSLNADSGERWVLTAADGKPIESWDSRGTAAVPDYDALRRPLTVSVTMSSGPPRTAEQITYGESLANAESLNLRGAVYQQRDEAGIATTNQRDFQGNVASASRQLLAAYSGDVDWSSAPALGTDTFTTATTYDALGRPVAITTPDGSVTSPVFNERSLLAQISATLGGSSTPVSYVTSVSYDPKGQRQLISYGNGATTSYAYDPDTFRLIQLQTTRPSAGNPLQNLTYTYDPVGNVTRIGDAAQQTIFFANQVVTPSADYTYDAIYRLTRATGREHIGQAAAPQTDWNDSVRISVPLPTDGQAMRNYTESYSYDEVGNITTVVHTAAGGNWTRSYAYDGPASPPASNQLTSTTVGSSTSSYSYDADGNMITMPQLQVMTWDWKNQLQSTALVPASDAAVPTTYYQYDASGHRARKATGSPAGTLTSERIYLGGYEVYREYSPTGTLTLQRQSLHVPDGARLICLVETTTVDASVPAGSGPSTVTRYQFGNLLGSAVLELDPTAAILTYEEYYPYGSTSFQTGSSAAEVSLKRYRYIGKERDPETGLYYYGARYYAPWLGRWVSYDPAGLADGPSGYAYVSGNPVRRADPSGRQGQDAEQVAAGQIRAATGLDPVDFVLSLHLGPLRMTAVRDAMIGSGLLKPDGSPAAQGPAPVAPPPPAQSQPSIGPTGQSRDDIHQAAFQHDMAEYYAQHPSSYDVVRANDAYLASKIDPSGMGVVKAPAAVAYMAAGNDPATAYAKAANVDAVLAPAAVLASVKAAPAEPGISVAEPDLALGAEVRPAVEAEPVSETEPAAGAAAAAAPAPTSIWGRGSYYQGQGAEAYIAANTSGEFFFGTFPDIDRAVYGPGGASAPALEIGQVKSIDTTAKSYQGNRFYNRIMAAAGDLPAGEGEATWSHGGHQVIVGPGTARVLDLVLPDTPLTPAQDLMLQNAITDAANMGVEIRVYRVH
jgi:RHS repeat-associated protein